MGNEASKAINVVKELTISDLLDQLNSTVNESNDRAYTIKNKLQSFRNDPEAISSGEDRKEKGLEPYSILEKLHCILYKLQEVNEVNLANINKFNEVI